MSSSPVIRTISFSAIKDKDLIAYIDSKKNKSSYMKSLIEKDMNAPQTSIDIETLIKKCLEKYICNNETKEKEELPDVQEAIQKIMNI